MQPTPLVKQGWLRALIFLLFLTIIIVLTGLYLLPWMEASGVITKVPDESTGEINFTAVFIDLTITSLASYLLVLLFRKLVDRSTVNSLGFQWTGYTSHALTGFLLGPLLIGSGTFVFILFRQLEWIDLHTDLKPLLLSMGMMGIIAFAEELVFRGYILNNLMQSMNKWIALLISAVVFSIFHSNNPEVSPLPLINLFFGGLLLGINYVYTKNLWFSILLHFTWNFYQGSILGYGVSGLTLPSLAHHNRTGSDWLTGGSFGFEGSVMCALVSLITLVFLGWTYEKKSAAPQK